MEDKNFPVEDWWDEDQLALVEDRSRIWQLKEFKPSQAFWIVRNGQTIAGKVSDHEKLPHDAVVEENLWDHEHCELCGSKIMNHEDYCKEGYFDGKEWVCKECYENYITPRIAE